MKKYKLWLISLALMTALMVNVSPVTVYANDGDDPQGTSQKKASPPQESLSPEMIAVIMAVLRMWW